MNDMQTQFFPKYSPAGQSTSFYTGKQVLERSGWAIGFYLDDKGVMLANADDSGTLLFGSERCCQLAIDILAQRGITTYDDIQKYPRGQIVAWCCEVLLW